MNPDGTQNTETLFDVLMELDSINKDFIKIIKSTVLPSTLKEIEIKFQNIVYNPEFLKERSAEEDFVNSEGIILGGKKEILTKVKELYKICSVVKKK